MIITFKLISIITLFASFLLMEPALASNLAVKHLNRLSFGISPFDPPSSSLSAYLQSQLNPQSIPYPPQLEQQLKQFPSLNMTPVEIYQRYEPKSEAEKPEKNEKKKAILQEAIQAHLLKATFSPRQLEELMVDFWLSHFNVYHDKGALIRMWIGTYEFQAIRPYALGNFRDLLNTTARHPAMLVYLDNWLNTAPDSPGAKGKYKGLNENYARELMELHTLGVDGGYTQEDVITLAKILTGWGLDANGDKGSKTGFYFYQNRHDNSEKVFLGKKIPSGGEEQGNQALDILANHPSTAKHISYKLAQYFYADEPPTQLVDKLSQKYLKTQGNIKAVLETLFNSPEFATLQNKKFKTPQQYVLSLVRASGIKNPDLKLMAGMMQQLGMSVYGCLTPDGYKNTQEAWLNPDAIIRRVSIATDIAQGKLSDRPVDTAFLAKTLKDNISLKNKKLIEQKPQDLQAALMLGSPEMMYR